MAKSSFTGSGASSYYFVTDFLNSNKGKQVRTGLKNTPADKTMPYWQGIYELFG
jgi:hypothetical protein